MSESSVDPLLKASILLVSFFNSIKVESTGQPPISFPTIKTRTLTSKLTPVQNRTLETRPLPGLRRGELVPVLGERIEDLAVELTKALMMALRRTKTTTRKGQ